MANMFKKTKEKSVKDYLASITGERKDTIIFFHNFIQEAVPKLKPHFAINMLGYGSFKCKNYKKEIIDWPVISMANQKLYVSIYVCALDNGGYLAEKYKDELGKVSVGRSCIRFKKVADVNLPMLKKVLKLAAKNPGLVPIS
jgi:hypothetical protein